MRTTENITPAFATHPGEIILDEIAANNISQSDLARQIGYKKSQLNEIIKGKRNINAELSLLLEKALGVEAEYWMEAQKKYDLDLAKVNKTNQLRLEAIEQWKLIKDSIAVSFYKKEKIISGDPIEDIPIIKNIYNVISFEELANINAQPIYTRFRKSTKLKVNPINIIGWVKLVHYKASHLRLGEFDFERKDELIKKLRLILWENKDTLIRIQDLLAEYGIKLIYQNKGDKTPIDGVSFWSDGVPAIGISLRHKRLDNFAFTLFHELGHVFEHLVNNNKAEFVDLIDEDKAYRNSKEEIEANSFAQNHLINPQNWNNFFERHQTFADDLIIDFANENEIHPCIVRGRICFTLEFYKARTSIDYSIN